MRRWLKPGGALLPDFATMFIAAADASAVDLAFWERVYGFSYAPVAAELHEAAQVGSCDQLPTLAYGLWLCCWWSSARAVEQLAARRCCTPSSACLAMGACQGDHT